MWLPTRVMPPPLTVPREMVTLFANHVFIAHLKASGLACIADVLRRYADGRKREKLVARTDGGMAVEDDVRDQFAVLAENDVGPDGAVGAHGATCRHHRRRCHNGCRVNAHSGLAVVTGEAAGCFCLGTNWHITIASQANLPSTVAVPSIRQAFERQFRTLISMRN